MFKKTLFAISVLILALFPTVSATNMYQANYYIQATKNPDIIYTTSFKSTIVNCSIELQNFVSVNTTSYTYISNTYYSPTGINGHEAKFHGYMTDYNCISITTVHLN